MRAKRTSEEPTQGQANWIDDRFCPVSGDTYVVDARIHADGNAPRRGEIGRWPRSSRDDVRAALEAATRGLAAWTKLGPSARRSMLERLIAELPRAAREDPLLAARLGCAEAELRPHLDIDLVLPADSSSSSSTTGLALVQAHWSELFAGASGMVLERLLAGQVVILIADARLPMVGDAIARACQRAELPPGALSVLHDDGDDTLSRCLASGEVVCVAASGYAADLKRIAYRARVAAGSEPQAEFGTTFGAGVVERPDVHAELDLRTLSSAIFVVPDEGDLNAVAAHVAQGAFGRSSTLSGQLPGQIGRVLCPERRLSGFTERLLACIETSADIGVPIEPLEADSEDAWRRIRELGLDEGATLILGNGPGAEPTPERRSAPEPSSPEGVEDGRFWGSVFTNVEVDGRLARLTRPAPVLRILRVGDEAAGNELARRLETPTEAAS